MYLAVSEGSLHRFFSFDGSTQDSIMEEEKKDGRGRPTVVTEKVLDIMENVFAIGGSDEEAYSQAGIAKKTFYNYQLKHPEFREKKFQLKKLPTVVARRAIYDDLKNVDTAKWYLERKQRKEFSTRTEHQHGGDKDNPINFTYEQAQRIIDRRAKSDTNSSEE